MPSASVTSLSVIAADAGVEDADLDLVVAQLLQRLHDRFGRTLYVRLDQDRQLLDVFVRLELLSQKLIERGRGTNTGRLELAWRLRCDSRRSRGRGLRSSLTTFRTSPGMRRAVETQHLDRHRRTRFLTRSP